MKLSIWIFLFTLVLTSLACRVPIASAKIEHAPKVGQATPEVGQEADRQMTVCNSGGLNVRRGAGTDNQVIGIIPDGTIVTLTGEESTPVITTWYEVQAGDLTGWVFGRYLCLEAN